MLMLHGIALACPAPFLNNIRTRAIQAAIAEFGPFMPGVNRAALDACGTVKFSCSVCYT